MKARLFGGDNCTKCIEAIVLIHKEGIKVYYTNAFSADEKIQKICDQYDVEDLPHIQFKNENDKIVFTHIGEINRKKLLEYIKKEKDGTKQSTTSSS